jgi:hypothetical protein
MSYGTLTLVTTFYQYPILVFSVIHIYILLPQSHFWKSVPMPICFSCLPLLSQARQNQGKGMNDTSTSTLPAPLSLWLSIPRTREEKIMNFLYYI